MAATAAGLSTHLEAFAVLLANDGETAPLHLRDLHVLAMLSAHEAPLTVGQIAVMIGVSSPYVSRIADKLAARGLLRRQTTNADRRLILLAPTPTGRALDERVRGHFTTMGVAHATPAQA